MKINWFPGHMIKALRVMEKEVKNIDIILYVLDARAPLACLNPEFNKIIKNKPILFILNKIDIADNVKIEKEKIEDCLLNYFSNKVDIVKLNSTMSGAKKIILEKINYLCREKIEKNASKNINAYIRGMVVGVPNCGKSTLINNLCGKGKTITGDKPGVTRGKQWVNVEKNIQILDTPGTLYPNLENQQFAKFLAYIGSIKDEVVDINELACDFISDVEKQYGTILNKRYQVELLGLPFEKIQQIAIKKNLLIKGGEIDFDRTCFMIIDDFRKGRLGNLTLI